MAETRSPVTSPTTPVPTETVWHLAKLVAYFWRNLSLPPSRTRLPVKALKCACFYDKHYFEFFPVQAVRAKSAQAQL